MAPHSDDPVSAIYPGEMGRRWGVVAVALTVAMPGLGHVYVGQPGRGIALWGLVATGWLSALVVPALSGGTDLVRATVAAALLHVWVTVVAAWSTARRCRRIGDRHRLRSYDHPAVYAAIFVAFGLVPTLLGLGVVVPHLWGLVRVEDRAMAPAWLPGDVVVYRREAFEAGASLAGQAVVVSLAGPRLALGRVVGVPGDAVGQQAGGLLVRDGEPVTGPAVGWLRCTPPQRRWGCPEGARVHHERVGDRVHRVFFEPDVTLADSAAVRVPPEAVWVLPDVRTADAVADSRLLGPVPVERLVGRPLQVVWSVDLHTGRLRWSRIGTGPSEEGPRPAAP